MAKSPKIKAASPPETSSEAALPPDNFEADAPETDAMPDGKEEAVASESADPSMEEGNATGENATPAPPDEGDGGGNLPAIDEQGSVTHREMHRMTHRVLSPLKCGGVVLAAGEEVELQLGADEIAALVVEGLIEALEP